MKCEKFDTPEGLLTDLRLEQERSPEEVAELDLLLKAEAPELYQRWSCYVHFKTVVSTPEQTKEIFAWIRLHQKPDSPAECFKLMAEADRENAPEHVKRFIWCLFYFPEVLAKQINPDFQARMKTAGLK